MSAMTDGTAPVLEGVAMARTGVKKCRRRDTEHRMCPAKRTERSGASTNCDP